MKKAIFAFVLLSLALQACAGIIPPSREQIDKEQEEQARINLEIALAVAWFPKGEFDGQALGEFLHQNAKPDILSMDVVQLKSAADFAISRAVSYIAPNSDMYQQIATDAGFGDASLLQAFYERASIPRGPDGYPQEGGVVFPAESAAAIMAGETSKKSWGEFADPTTPGDWGTHHSYHNPEGKMTDLGSQFIERCNQGLEVLAESLIAKYPTTYAWETPQTLAPKIYTSTTCAVGRTQVLANYFAPGAMYNGLVDKDVWNEPQTIADVTLIHLVTRSCKRVNGTENYYQTQSSKSLLQDEAVKWALCGYNPGAWPENGKGVRFDTYDASAHKWYWDVLFGNAQRLRLTYTQTTATFIDGKVLLWPIQPGTRRFGYEFGEPTWYNSFHAGIDINNGTDVGGANTESYASCKGSILEAYEDTGSGGVLTIQCDENTYPGHSVRIRYIHLDTPLTEILGQSVTVGEYLGLAVDKWYYSNGAHLHFEVKIDGILVDPLDYLYDWDQLIVQP